MAMSLSLGRSFKSSFISVSVSLVFFMVTSVESRFSLIEISSGFWSLTFYILAVYFGSVGVRNTRYSVACGLIADFAGILAAIL